MALPAIRFAPDATDDTWTWVVERLAGTTVRVRTNDGAAPVEGEIADAAAGQIMIEDPYAMVRRTIPAALISGITVL
jgi:hypothetical protein